MKADTSISTENLFDPPQDGGGLDWESVLQLRCLEEPEQSTTGTFEIDPSESRCAGMFHSLMSAVLISWGSAVAQGTSRHLHPLWRSVVPVAMRREEFEDQFASFFEPVEYNWSNSQFVAREAARRFCEGSYADY